MALYWNLVQILFTESHSLAEESAIPFQELRPIVEEDIINIHQTSEPS